MSATRIALQTEDILHDIFDWLTPSLEWNYHCGQSKLNPAHQRTLCAAARVCKAFSQPALKSLWTHVPSIEVLFSILSSSMKIVSDVKIPENDREPAEVPPFQETVWIMDGPVSDDERERFIWYSQFIQTIKLYTSRRVDPWVFLRLSQEHLGMPLTPRLRTIYCEQDWPYLDMAVSLLSGPALHDLALMFNGPNCTVDDDLKLPLNRHNYAPRPLLKLVSATAPNLERLTVHMCARASLLHPIGGMKKLRMLDLSQLWVSIDMDLLRELSGLDMLEELALPNSFVGLDVTPCKGFKNLKTLIVRNGVWTIPKMLNALPDLRLKELRLSKAVISDFGVMRTLVSSLSQASRSTIESVSIEDLTASSHVIAEPVTMLIGPLLVLPNIRNFVLSAEDPLRIADEDLRAVGGAWPKLAKLRLQCTTVYKSETVAPTIRGIIELANLCPDLRQVYFSSVIPALASTPGNVVLPYRSEGVRELPLDIHVDDDDIDDELHVARVLWSVFRRLRVPSLDRTWYEKWTAVVDEVARLQDELEKEYRIKWSMC